MRRVSVAAGLALLAGSLTQAGASSGNGPALAVLSQALSAPATVAYSGIVESLRMGSHATEASVYRIEHRPPDLTRRTYSAPPAYSGDSVITKGGLDYAVDTARHRIVETENEAPVDRLALGDDESLIRENYRAVEQGDETFDGRPTVDVLLINNYTRRPTMFVRIDRQSKVVLDKQEFAPDGALISEIRFEQVRYAAVPPADFSLPRGYALVQAQRIDETSRNPDQLVRDAGFGARKPRSLPDGFASLDGNLVELHGVRTVQFLYSDGVRTVSLFESSTAVAPDMAPFHPETVNVGSRGGEYAEDGAVALLAWSDGALHYTLVGELGRAELQQIAGTITP